MVALRVQEKRDGESGMAGGILKRLLQMIIFLTVPTAILFVPAGRLDWPMAWIYIGSFGASLLITGLYLQLRDPDPLRERAQIKPGPDVKKWDTVISSLFRLSYAVTLALSGLDMRFRWTKSLPPALQILALAFGVLGYGLIMWAMASNPFFTVYTCIQRQRGHTVTTAGPYRIVPHPGYVGLITIAIVTPLVLGSLWALVSGAFGALLMIVKTALEDRVLHEELEGYKDCARRVRHRLLPGIW